MTFSILAFDRSSNAIGTAAATGNLAVGAWVLRAAAGTGAVATQGACVSTLWGDDALARLSKGETASAVIHRVTTPDTGREHRQLAVLDAAGDVAAWTGGANPDSKGHILGSGYVIAGNWLSGDAVLREMERAYCGWEELGYFGFGRRLLATLSAAMEAGSDSRGTFSAAMKIVSTDRPPIDLRVDYDEDPLVRLMALHDRASNAAYGDWLRTLPTADDPYRC